MTDKELLLLAAKAAGVSGKYVEDYATGDYYADQFYTGPDCGILTGDGHLASVWNPLTDDGDALRLAVKLDMMVDVRGAWAAVEAAGNSVYEDARHDPLAATRRAIVRAAAEIGARL